MTDGLNIHRRWKSVRSGICGGAALAISLLSNSSAFAVSDRVKSACRDDYFQHCSQYMVGSEELRQCMRKVGEDLSTPCLVALVQDGEITKEDVERHNAAKAGAAKTDPAAKKTRVGQAASDATEDPKTAEASTPAKTAKSHKTLSKKEHTKKSAAKSASKQKGSSGAAAASATTHPTGKKAKSGTSSKTAKKSVAGKKKTTAGKATKTSKATAAGTATAPAGKKGAHSKSTAKAAHGKVKSTKTASGAATAAKAKKVSKKKAAAKRATKPADAASQ